ncbi:DMP19 family protein [Myroides injenensis]|uniref:DMP19 family protein n=1 Tax=Myroides injenensis TaxID=1183151 RepID=UPI000288EFCC|nr:hypothetical protein [Myroides injenensis]
MKEFEYILISESAYNSDNILDILNSNISVVNYLRNSNIGDDELHPDAFSSYCVDYYYKTLSEEGFPAFVWKSKWDMDLIEIIQAGLIAMDAKEHLEYFEKQMRRIKALSKIKLSKFLTTEFNKDKELISLIDDQSHTTIETNLQELNASWLKNHPDIKVASLEEMQEIITDFIA